MAHTDPVWPGDDPFWPDDDPCYVTFRVVCDSPAHAPRRAICASAHVRAKDGNYDRRTMGLAVGEPDAYHYLIDDKVVRPSPDGGAGNRAPDFEALAASRGRYSLIRCPLCQGAGPSVQLREETARDLVAGCLKAGVLALRLADLAARV
jgi:hypothetical protein